MENILTASFLIISGFLWVSIFGYYLLLLLLSLRFRGRNFEVKEWPEIAVVVPSLNEQDLIVDKLADIKKCDYPQERIHLYVIDGGSKDETIHLVKNEISNGAPIQLICIDDQSGKIGQINHALNIVHQEFVVFTDADARLEPSCIKNLVRMILSDTRTAVAGATIVPRGDLLEEKIHWRVLNHMWRLEGEVLSCAGISGVCYAVRRKAIKVLNRTSLTEDIHMALASRIRKFRVRLSPNAIANEIRTPQNLKDLLGFRRRRGKGYLAELLLFPILTPAPLRWHIFRGVRIWHFIFAPRLTIVIIILGAASALFSNWQIVLGISSVFVLSTISVLFPLIRNLGNAFGWKRLSIACLRYIAIIFISLLTLDERTSGQVAQGGGV
jgi:cellulose synthase/poly-beta-1,6-N-acetylglucosamine synthase-like glycosyltransferase